MAIGDTYRESGPDGRQRWLRLAAAWTARGKAIRRYRTDSGGELTVQATDDRRALAEFRAILFRREEE